MLKTIMQYVDSCSACCCFRLVLLLLVLPLLPLCPLLPLLPLLPRAAAVVRVHAAESRPALPKVLWHVGPLVAVLLPTPPLLLLLLLLFCLMLLTAAGSKLLPVWVGIWVTARKDSRGCKQRTAVPSEE
jgi:hypothetical protein